MWALLDRIKQKKDMEHTNASKRKVYEEDDDDACVPYDTTLGGKTITDKNKESDKILQGLPEQQQQQLDACVPTGNKRLRKEVKLDKKEENEEEIVYGMSCIICGTCGHPDEFKQCDYCKMWLCYSDRCSVEIKYSFFCKSCPLYGELDELSSD